MIVLPEMGSPVIVQGITGKFGSYHTTLMLQYGTNIAAGVTPGRAGERVMGVKVYDTMADAVLKTGARTSVIFVPAPNFYAAAEEALRAGVRLLVAITEHVPIQDELKVVELSKIHGATVVGPNTPGLIIPSRLIKLGIMPATSFRPGSVALFSRSGTLMYEIANQISMKGLGQALAAGVGGDPVNGSTMIDYFELVRNRDDVNAVVAVGEIGGDSEERLAAYITETKYPKPVFAYIAGRAAPKEKRMGHAGAIIYGSFGTAESKISALRAAGVKVAMTPWEIPELLSATLGR
jgi:succinyl-CoA synthetase alpha subunit